MSKPLTPTHHRKPLDVAAVQWTGDNLEELTDLGAGHAVHIEERIVPARGPGFGELHQVLVANAVAVVPRPAPLVDSKCVLELGDWLVYSARPEQFFRMTAGEFDGMFAITDDESLPTMSFTPNDDGTGFDLEMVPAGAPSSLEELVVIMEHMVTLQRMANAGVALLAAIEEHDVDLPLGEEGYDAVAIIRAFRSARDDDSDGGPAADV